MARVKSFTNQIGFRAKNWKGCYGHSPNSVMIEKLGRAPATERWDYFGTLFIVLTPPERCVGGLGLTLKRKCVCMSVRVCVEEKKGTKVRWRETKISDVRGATAESYKKIPRSPTMNSVCVYMGAALCVHVLHVYVLIQIKRIWTFSCIMQVCVWCARMWTCVWGDLWVAENHRVQGKV